MIEFIDISLRNFLSFGNVKQTMKLNNKAFNVIVGKNLDKSADDENNRNGVGKTTLFQAIHYSLFGKSIGNKITLTTLVNNINKKNMEVELNFIKDDVQYKIERGRNPTYLHFYKNGEEVIDESLGDSRDTQALIEQVLGMNEDLFCQTVLLSCQVPIFMEQSTANQKMLIEKILGVDIITEKIQALKEKIKDTKNEINNESFKVSTLKTQRDTNKASLEKQLLDINIAEQNWLNGIQQKKNEYQKVIDTYGKIDFDLENKLIQEKKEYDKVVESNKESQKKIDQYIASAVDISNQIKSLTTNKEQLKSVDIEAEKKKFDEIDKINKELLEYTQQEAKYNAFLSDKKVLEKEYNGYEEQVKQKRALLDNVKENICPTCGQPMNADKVKEYKDGIQKEINELMDKSHKTNIEIMELVAEAGPFEKKTFEFPQTIYKTREELLSLESQIKECDIKVESLMGQLNKIVEDKEAIKLLEEKKPERNSVFTDEIQLVSAKNMLDNATKQLAELSGETNNPYTQQKEVIKKSLEEVNVDIDETLLSELSSDQEHNELLLKLLNSPSSYIRQAILDKSLDFLNNKIKGYLGKLGSQHIVKFNNDMSIDISSNGLEYGYISSGEMGRVSIALTLSFRDVWENLNNNSTNLFMIDEVLDRSGLDTNGIKMLINCIKETVDKNILLVTHNDSIISSASKIIQIVKENSFSTIVK